MHQLDESQRGSHSLFEDAGLRLQLSFFYQESLHRSDRIDSRITGYAAALYEMVGPRGGLVRRYTNLSDEIPATDNEGYDRRAAVTNFLIAARTGRFSSLLTAEQNYTEFMIVQLNVQIEAIKSLQESVANVVDRGNTDKLRERSPVWIFHQKHLVGAGYQESAGSK